MQACRINNRLPQVTRVFKSAPSTRNMSLFPRFVQSEFAPMFRLLDEYANHAATRTGSNGFSRSFQPRFDVKENKDAYELQGELPGIEQKDINIEFTDANTLSIHGRTEHSREEGTPPAGLVEGQGEQAKLTEGTAESNGYHKPSVEDENASVAATTPAGENSVVGAASQEVKGAGSKYWMSERSVGQFSRTFSFPNRVDQENVKASLNNGILSVVIPKAAPPANKRINIE